LEDAFTVSVRFYRIKNHVYNVTGRSTVHQTLLYALVALRKKWVTKGVNEKVYFRNNLLA